MMRAEQDAADIAAANLDYDERAQISTDDKRHIEYRARNLGITPWSYHNTNALIAQWDDYGSDNSDEALDYQLTNYWANRR